MTTLKLTFLDTLDNKHDLYYNIANTGLARRWADITRQNQAIADSYIHARLSNVAYNQIVRVRQQLTECINSINSSYDQPLPPYEDIVELTTVELNYLHEEFERYGDRHLRGELGLHNGRQHDDFLRLNELIHLHEDVLASRTQPFPPMHMLYDYYPQGLHLPIEEADKLHLEADTKWGGLYLGYNTLGKDWMKVQYDNDIEVIERGQVRPQGRFAAETWINFGPDCATGWTATKFEAWYNTLQPQLRDLVPIGNLNQLTLGRFRIGTLVIDDSFLSKYGGTRQEYSVPNSTAKANWNREIFSTFTELLGVKIIND